ncbi:MAG: LPS export ABC transporter permease LptF [Gammaproteobacteria bacterium RIFCSPHIGHO2_12_FULL_38_14]|nr:MAG: LPS export ABC transporter permease LptF [Gammaproteobacteria bacterium RIFCSPHIGHO2_12_FULL_38_14]
MIIARYFTREVSRALLTITIVLVIAFASQQFVRYLNYAAIGKIPLDILLELLGFEVPYLLALLLPLGLYLGILFAYGRLYADSEMSILQLYGVDQLKILRFTLLIIFSVTVFVGLLMLWVNPWISLKRQEVMTSDYATLHLIQTITPGRFQVSPDGRHVMYVEKLSRDRERAENVFLAEAKDTHDTNLVPSWMLVSATDGYQEKDKNSNDPLFVTTNGYRYEGVPGQNDYKIIQFGKYTIRLPQASNHITHADTEALSSSELWQQYQSPKQAAELQWRLSVGISVVLLAFLAIPLSVVRPRQGRYAILIPAVLIYIVYINLLFISRRWVEQHAVPIHIGMWWVHGIMILIVLAMFYRAKRFAGC